MFNYGKLVKVSVSEANSVLSDVIDYGLGKTIFSSLGLTAKDFDFVETSELMSGISLLFNCSLDSKQFIAGFIVGYASHLGNQDVLKKLKSIDLLIEVKLVGELDWNLSNFYEDGRVDVNLIVSFGNMSQLVVQRTSIWGIHGSYN